MEQTVKIENWKDVDQCYAEMIGLRALIQGITGKFDPKITALIQERDKQVAPLLEKFKNLHEAVEAFGNEHKADFAEQRTRTAYGGMVMGCRKIAAYVREVKPMETVLDRLERSKVFGPLFLKRADPTIDKAAVIYAWKNGKIKPDALTKLGLEIVDNDEKFSFKLPEV